MPWLLALLPAKPGEAIKSFFDFLKSPVGIALIILLAFGGGHWLGSSSAKARCEDDKKASIEKAAEIDRNAAASALRNMERQKEAAIARANASQEQFERYKNELAARAPEAGCLLSDPDLPHLERVPNVRTGPATVAPLPPKRHR